MIYLFNKNEELFKIIPKKDVIDPITDEILNGLLQIDVEVLDKHFEYVKNAEFIGHKDYENKNIFYLYKINSINTNNYNLKITGLHTVFDDLKSYGYIKDKRPTNTTADIALAQILEGSRWEVGKVQVSNTGSANFYDISRLDALSKLIDVWKCEIGYRMIFDGQKIIGRYIDLYNQRGTDTGKRFVYGTNALTIEYEENKNEIYTALVGRGKGEEKYDEEGNPTGGYGRKITFENIEWSKSNGDPVDKPLGQDYVEIPEMTSLYGYSDGSPRVKLVDYNDIEDPEELLQVTYNDLSNTSRPKVQFKSTVERIGNIHIGDTVRIIRQDFGFYYTARVFEIKRNLLNNAKTEVKLGDYINRSSAKKNKELRNELKNLSHSLSQIAVNTDLKKESLVKQIQDYLTTSLYNEDGYNYDLRAGNEYNLPAGYYSFDSPIELNPTKVIYVGAGKMAIANEKDSNGDWKWTTWGTGDGLVADAIVAGMLSGGKVHFDLTNGTLLIGNSTDDYSLLWDGSTLNIKGNVDITANPTIKGINDALDSQGKIIDSQGKTIDSHGNTIDSQGNIIEAHDTEIEKYKDGKLVGQTYSFTGSAFSIGGRSGDMAEHNNSKSKWTHSDGSYTEIGAKEMERYIAGSGHNYHFLIHVATFVAGSSSGRWIQLPNEFKGKKFSVYYAMADSLQNPEGILASALHRFVATGTPGESIDYTNAKVPVTGYKLTIDLSNNYKRSTSNIQGMLIAIY